MFIPQENFEHIKNAGSLIRNPALIFTHFSQDNPLACLYQKKQVLLNNGHFMILILK